MARTATARIFRIMQLLSSLHGWCAGILSNSGESGPVLEARNEEQEQTSSLLCGVFRIRVELGGIGDLCVDMPFRR